MMRLVYITIILSALAGGILTGIAATYICIVHPDRIIIKIEYRDQIVKQTVIKTKTQIVYRNGYQYVGQDPMWNCAGNWYNAYLRIVSDPNNETASHSGDWTVYCPGIPQPAN